MCGIIGIVGQSGQAAPLVLEGLKRLEYRGYDSAGIATIAKGAIHRRRAPGKLVHLEKLLAKEPLLGATAIGHTRWATHGVPNEANAHPHATDKVALVHNGIVENYRSLRTDLIKAGYRFTSETDSEVIAVLITQLLDSGLAPREAVTAALKQLQGALAFVVLFRDHPQLLIGVQHGAPLAVGYGDGAMYLGSDALALTHLTQRVAYLEVGDMAILTPTSVDITQGGAPAQRPIRTLNITEHAAARGEYAHYMQKEIHEQPVVVGQTLGAWYDAANSCFTLPELPLAAKKIRRIHLVACGTSYYAALTARYWLEQIAGIPTDADIASEFRYRAPILAKDELTIVISQSGETADTLAALRYAKPLTPTLAIVNVAESSIAREAHAWLQTLAGPEIGVASTKAFTTQLAVLAALTLSLAKARKTQTPETLQTLTATLLHAPSAMADALSLEPQIKAVAGLIAQARDVLYLGRGTSYALAHEGALKLKEISYIHAEAYAAGEMKHGPIALIDESVPVIAIAPHDALFEKTVSNLQETSARGGKIIAFSDDSGCGELKHISTACITMPTMHPFITPLAYSVPVQLLAYHIALIKGTDVDQPRNLAKSVTVE